MDNRAGHYGSNLIQYLDIFLLNRNLQYNVFAILSPSFKGNIGIFFYIKHSLISHHKKYIDTY